MNAVLPKEEIERRSLMDLAVRLQLAKAERQRNGLDKVFLCPKHLAFYNLESKVQALLGGNRAGKSHTGCYKIYRLMDGTHPSQLAGKFQKPPLKIRIAANDFSAGIETVIMTKLMALKPDDWSYEYDKRNHILLMRNSQGVVSTIYLNSYDQERRKHSGIDLDVCWFDEEPPFLLYKENRMRLLDRHGIMIMTFTADNGMTWSHKVLVKNKDKDVEVVRMSTRDNVDENGVQRISEEEIASICRGLSKAEVDIKIGGNYASLSGLVFPEFDPEKHVVDFDLPRDVTRWQAIDYHMRQPVHALYAATDKDGVVYIYDELVVGGPGASIRVMSDEMKQKEHGQFICQRLIDPLSVTPSRTADIVVTPKDEFISCGIVPLINANKSHVRFSKLRQWLTDPGKLKIHPRCEVFIDQLISYQYRDPASTKNEVVPEEVRKVDDHLVDCALYLAVHDIFYDARYVNAA